MPTPLPTPLPTGGKKYACNLWKFGSKKHTLYEPAKELNLGALKSHPLGPIFSGGSELARTTWRASWRVSWRASWRVSWRTTWRASWRRLGACFLRAEIRVKFGWKFAWILRPFAHVFIQKRTGLLSLSCPPADLFGSSWSPVTGDASSRMPVNLLDEDLRMLD